jgi:hypothetical protein
MRLFSKIALMPANDMLDFRVPADRVIYQCRVARELRYETLSGLRDEIERLGAADGMHRPRRSRLELVRRLANARVAKSTGLPIEEMARSSFVKNDNN